MKTPILFSVNLFKYLTIGLLCLFFTGSINVAYQYFHVDVNKGRTYCCCAGEMVDECNCSGGCCSTENDFSLSISKRACGELKVLKTASIEFTVTFDLFEYPNTFPNAYKPVNGYRFSKSLPYIWSIDKPPQYSFVV